MPKNRKTLMKIFFNFWIVLHPQIPDFQIVSLDCSSENSTTKISTMPNEFVSL